jgi:transposase
MQFIQGKDRSQSLLFPESLDQIIGPEHEVRVIDAFISSIDPIAFGFKVKTTFEGRPAYDPKDLLKLFLYGYLNRIRSSRALEKECYRNIEVMWLLGQLAPDHNTISNFRRDNPDAIKKLFRYTVSIAKQFDLIGGALVAGDSTKLRAQNSKKNNYNPKKLEKHLLYIDSKLEEYTEALSQADGDPKVLEDIEKNIAKHSKQRGKYIQMQKELEETGDTQISTSDPDSRQMITRNNITEVAYNVQTVVDAKHNLPIEYKVTNQNDSKAMGEMVERTCEILGTTDFVALYDKGYHTGSEFKTAFELGVDVMVAIPEVASNAPDTKFNISEFGYDPIQDVYTCPANQLLSSNGRWYKKDRGRSVTMVKHYKTQACDGCRFRMQCTVNPAGRLIERSQHQEYINLNKQLIDEDKEIYRKRQAIVEHPYGTIKRQWSFCHITTKRFIHRASADVGFIFVAYNLKRIMNILNKKVLIEFLEKLALYFLRILVSPKVQASFLSLPILPHNTGKLFFRLAYIEAKELIFDQALQYLDGLTLAPILGNDIIIENPFFI